MASRLHVKYAFIIGSFLAISILYIAWQQIFWNHLRTEDSLNLTALAINAQFSSEKLDQQPFDKSVKKNFEDALKGRADNKGYIAISLIDSGYLDIAINLCMSYKQINLTNYLFISSDDKACQDLMAEVADALCLQYVFDTDAAQPSSYGSKAFFRKANRKTKIVLDALSLGYNVLLVDLDIFFFKNPFPYLAKCPDCDLQVEWDHGVSCSGFYLARSTKAGMLYKHIINPLLNRLYPIKFLIISLHL